MARSKKSHARLESRSRTLKARKIVSVLADFVNLKECSVLDIGTGSGHIIRHISQLCKSASSVDLHDERMVKSGYSFRKVKDERLPFGNNTFDVVISNHVIEHMPNQKLHISEIARVLKRNGVLYLATPNRFWILDPHYRLPFISWLPKRASALYLKIIKKREWDIYPLSYLGLLRIAKKMFRVYNMTLNVMKNPKKYNLNVSRGVQLFIKAIPLLVLKIMNAFLPTFILVLRKR